MSNVQPIKHVDLGSLCLVDGRGAVLWENLHNYADAAEALAEAADKVLRGLDVLRAVQQPADLAPFDQELRAALSCYEEARR